MKTQKTILLDVSKLKKHYADIVPLLDIFGHEVIEDQDGVYRFKRNSLMCRLCDNGPVYTPPSDVRLYGAHSSEIRASVSLNGLWIDLYHHEFSILELMKFYMQMGYSLSGFIEIFWQREASEFFDDAAEFGDSELSVMEYVSVKYKGKRILL